MVGISQITETKYHSGISLVPKTGDDLAAAGTSQHGGLLKPNQNNNKRGEHRTVLKDSRRWAFSLFPNHIPMMPEYLAERSGLSWPNFLVKNGEETAFCCCLEAEMCLEWFHFLLGDLETNVFCCINLRQCGSGFLIFFLRSSQL